jgi:nitrogen fixation protein FixH
MLCCVADFAETLVRLRAPRLQPASGPPAARRSRWIPYSFFGFFAVVIAVNAVMLAFALGTFNGLSEEGAYDRGLGYDRELAEFAAQRALGWHLDAALAPAGDLVVTATDGSGAPLTDATLTATLLRPTQASLDQTVGLAEEAPGTYGARVALPVPGLWTVRIDAVRGDDSYRYEQRVTLR